MVRPHRRSKICSRRQPLDGLTGEAPLGILPVQGEGHDTPASLQRLGPLPLVRKEVLERGEQERAEPPLRGIHRLQEIPLQEMCEEGLGQVSGGLGIVASAAGVGVKRVPVGAAQRLERVARLRTRMASRREHHAPLGGWKTGSNVRRLRSYRWWQFYAQ